MIKIKFWKKINNIISNTQLFSFICLCLILVLLLITTTSSIFCPLDEESGTEKLDIVLRTSLSSIFGYIISTTASEKVEVEKTTTKSDKSMQIVMIALICIYCLIVTLICRSFSDKIIFTTSSIATITQYRDFICSSIGALIGLSKSKS